MFVAAAAANSRSSPLRTRKQARGIQARKEARTSGHPKRATTESLRITTARKMTLPPRTGRKKSGEKQRTKPATGTPRPTLKAIHRQFHLRRKARGVRELSNPALVIPERGKKEQQRQRSTQYRRLKPLQQKHAAAGAVRRGARKGPLLGQGSLSLLQPRRVRYPPSPLGDERTRSGPRPLWLNLRCPSRASVATLREPSLLAAAEPLRTGLLTVTGTHLPPARTVELKMRVTSEKRKELMMTTTMAIILALRMRTSGALAAARMRMRTVVLEDPQRGRGGREGLAARDDAKQIMLPWPSQGRAIRCLCIRLGYGTGVKRCRHSQALSARRFEVVFLAWKC